MAIVMVTAKNGNTSNLYSHLKTHHIELYNRLKPRGGRSGVGTTSQAGPNQCTIAESFQKAQMLEEGSKEYKELTKGATFCLAKDILPLHTVEKPGFVKILH